MKRFLTFLTLTALFCVNCATSASYHEYRPALLLGDKVLVTGGMFAESVGTVSAIKLNEDSYEVRLLDREQPALIRANLLKKIGSAERPARNEIRPQAYYYPGSGGALVVEEVEAVPAGEERAVPYYPGHQEIVVEEVEAGVALEAAPVETPPPAPGKSRLAVLPIVGVEEYIAETLAWHLANQRVISANFNIVPITPNIRKNILSEQSYGAFFDAGEDVHANYIMSSFVRNIGCQKVFFTVVLDVETRQQLAGDYCKYNDIQELPSYFPRMAKKIINTIQNKNDTAPRLSVEIMAVPSQGINKHDAVVLSQLFAITMANTNAFKVFPRTDNIDAAVLEYETRRSSAKKVFFSRDELEPADYLLSSKISVFGSKNEILAEIIGVENDVLLKGAHIDFDIIEDVPELLGRLSNLLVNPPRQRL